MSTIRTRTPKLKLNIPIYDRSGWEAPVDENWYILDGAIATFIAATGILGVWKNSTQYFVGDTVVDADDGSTWTAKTAHTSPSLGSFEDARAARPYWTAAKSNVPQGEGAIVRPEDFGADPSNAGSQNNQDAIQKALDEAIRQGVPLQLDSLWRIDSPVIGDLDNDDICRVQGCGGLIAGADLNGRALLEVRASAAYIGAVTAIDNAATYDFGSGVPTPCAKLTVTLATDEDGTLSGIQAGSICRVISEDQIPNESAGRLLGEVVYIAAIEEVSGVPTGVVYATSPLRNTFSTNIRIAAYRQGKNVNITNIMLSNPWEQLVAGAWQNGCLRISGLVSPVIDKVSCRNIGDYGILNSGCVGAIGICPRFERGLRAPSSKLLDGRGWRDNSGVGTTILAPSGYDVSSIVSGGCASSSPSDPWTYGVTETLTVDSGKANSCSNIAWELTEGTEGCTLSSLTTVNTYKGEQSAQCGISLKGRGHIVDTYRHIGDGTGIQVKSAVTGVQNRHVINDMRYNGSGMGLELEGTAGEIALQFGTISIVTTDDAGVEITNGYLFGERLGITSLCPTPGRKLLELHANARPEIDRFVGDFSIVNVGSGNNSYVITYDGANVSATIHGGELRTGVNDWYLLRWSGGTEVAAALEARLDADKAPAGPDGLASINLTSGLRLHLTANGGKDYSSAIRNVTPSGTGSFTLDINGSIAQVIQRIYQVSLQRAITPFTPGVLVGQELIVANAVTSTANLLINHNPGGLIQTNATVTLAPGSAIGFIWTGALWVCYSISVAVTGATPISAHGGLSGLLNDDHTQYHTDARALTWLNSRLLEDLGDVPAKGAIGTVPRSTGAAAGNLMEWKKPLEFLPARDVAGTIGPTGHATATAGKSAASISLYPPGGDVAAAALRLIGLAGGVKLLELYNDLLASIFEVIQFSDGTCELRMRAANGTTVKQFLSSSFAVIGGDKGDRSSTSQLTVIGDLYVSGAINGPNQPGNFSNPYLIGVVRVWDDGAGKLRAKSGADPTTATDGSVLW